MQIFYSIAKRVYYVLTIIVGIFFLRGELILGDSYLVLLEYLIPGYLLLSGLMLGYVIARIVTINTPNEQKHHEIRMKSFVIGLLLGVILALLYSFLR